MTDDIESLVSGASTEQLRKLLALAEDQPQNPEATISTLADPYDLITALDEVAPESGAGERWVTVLLNTSTPILELRELQGAAKRLSAEAKRTGHAAGHAAADLLYHATVAAAFLRHGVTISSRPVADRKRLYTELGELLESGPLAELFIEVVRII